MPHPLTSIGVPVYNEGRHLRTTLDSLLAQTYDPLEIVVSDNASTDDTEAICREYAARDSRIRYFRQSVNLGSAQNFNLTLGLASGEYFKWAGGHDSLHPELVGRCVEVLRSDPTLALCYPPVRQNGKDIAGCVDTRRESDAFARLGYVSWGMSGGAVYGVFRTELLRRTLLFERVIAPDVILLAELSVLGGFARVEGPELALSHAADFGDLTAYVRKIFGETAHPASLYRRALLRLCYRTGRHFRARGKARACLIAAPAFRARFTEMRDGLREMQKGPAV